MKRWPDRRDREAGFSLPELLSVMIVSVMFSSLIIYFAFTYWRGTATLESDLQTLVSRLTAGDILRDSINESSGLIIQNSIQDNNAHKPDTAGAGSMYWQPLHAVPGTIANEGPGTYSPVLYFRRPSTDISKNTILNGIQPYEDEYVLYIDGTAKELRLRSLANTAAAGSRIKTSCPKSLATSTCPSDRKVAENVESVEMRYFSRSGNPVDYTSIVDTVTGEYIGPDFPAVEVVEFNLRLSKKSQLKGGQDTSNQTVIRIALRSS